MHGPITPAKGTKASTVTAAEMLRRMFPPGSRIFLASYANDQSEKKRYPTREEVITDPADVTEFISDNDEPGRACYFAVNPVRKNQRGKDQVAQITVQHADIDLKGIEENREQVEAAIKTLELKPTTAVFSGHGLHLYWKFKRPLSSAQLASHEERLQQLSDLLAADPSVAQVACVLRLPGSHNSKGGDWIEVQVIDELSSWQSYTVNEIDRWLDRAEHTGPVLTRKPPPQKPSDPNLNEYQKFGREARAHSGKFNADDVLDALVMHDTNGNGVDDSITAVVGAMVHEGRPVEDAIDILLKPIQQAFERDRWPSDGAWSEKKVTSKIRTKYEYFQRRDAKKQRPKPEAAMKDEPAPKHKTNKAGKKIHEPEFDPPEPVTITVEGGALSRMATEGEQVMIKTRQRIYQRGGVLVRPVIEDVDAAHGRTTKVAELKMIDPVYLRDRLTIVADWQRYDARSRDMVATNCPVEVAATILARHGDWQFPKIAGVSTTPTMRADGSLLTKAGYDKATRLLLVDPPELPAMPERPTKKDAETALKLLEGLLVEFPLVDNVAKAVALSALITPIVRGAFPTTPMHVSRAPTAGSGKSYLWDTVSAISLGHAMPVISAGHNDEETEKRLGAALIAGRPLISIDNVNGEIGGDALCQTIDRPFVDVRILGRSELVRIEARGTTVFATGNNIMIRGDLCRRTLMAVLDPEMERPELREFKGDPVARVLADRGAYIAAALTICRAYLLAGRPNKAKPLASFEGWSDCVRSALVWLGKADPIESMELVRAEDPDLAKLRDVLQAWNTFYNSKQLQRVTLAQVIEDANTTDSFKNLPEYPELHDAIHAAAGYRGPADVTKLGHWLRRRKNKIVDGLRLCMQANRKGGSLWWVEKAR